MITQAGGAGAATISGNGGVINLNNNSNNLTGPVTISNCVGADCTNTSAVTLNNTGTLNLAASNLASGNVNVNSTGPMNVNGAFSAAGGNLNLTTLPNNTLTLLTINPTGSVSTTNGGNVTLTSANNAAGTGFGLIVNGLVSSGTAGTGTLTVNGGVTLGVAPNVGVGNVVSR